MQRFRSLGEIRIAAGSRYDEGQRGTTIVELLLSFALLTVSMGGIMMLLTSTHGLKQTNQDTRRASGAGLRAVETLKGETFSEIFIRFNATALDDPATGASPGANFDELGLEAVDGDADGLPGQFQFPGDGVSLREDVVDRDLGMPRDLNGDGLIDALDHSADYIVLPVRVVIQWRDVAGDRTESFVTILSEN